MSTDATYQSTSSRTGEPGVYMTPVPKVVSTPGTSDCALRAPARQLVLNGKRE